MVLTQNRLNRTRPLSEKQFEDDNFERTETLWFRLPGKAHTYIHISQTVVTTSNASGDFVVFVCQTHTYIHSHVDSVWQKRRTHHTHKTMKSAETVYTILCIVLYSSVPRYRATRTETDAKTSSREITKASVLYQSACVLAKHNKPGVHHMTHTHTHTHLFCLPLLFSCVHL